MSTILDSKVVKVFKIIKNLDRDDRFFYEVIVESKDSKESILRTRSLKELASFIYYEF